jgi:hypothetical protein
MKHLVLGLTFLSLALAESPKVSECFKVHSMIRADEAHYWSTWTNTCPYTIDSVYVMVGFADQSSKNVADGVWSLHFIAPGAHRTVRFSAPGSLSDFSSVRQKKITADLAEAFGREPQKALNSVEMAAVSAYKHAVRKDEAAEPRATLVATASTVIGDAGEAPYRYQSPVQPAPQPAVSAVSTSASFRTDFPDAWRAVLSVSESAFTPASNGAFVKFLVDEKP